MFGRTLFPTPENTASKAIAGIATVWTLSDLGFYFLLPALGNTSSYNLSPIATSLYYLFWVGIAVIGFWPQYASWPEYTQWRTFENRLTSIVIWTLAFAAATLFSAYVLPALPPFNIRSGTNPPELPLATPWYFLPKSVEILFQQLLVAALVLTLSAGRRPIRTIALYCATLFGVAHMLLALGDVPWGYVFRFAVLATIFGAMFPYLILRVPNGFAYSYVLHWSYYAVTVLVARLLGS